MMFALFHFFFDLFKISIQAAVYSSMLMALLFVLSKVSCIKRPKLGSYPLMYFLIACALLVFSFTYYGEHGLGDESQIPLGYWKEMNASDGNAYFDLKPNNQILVDSFLVRNDHLYMASDEVYYDYKLSSGEWMQFNSKKTYEDYAQLHQLPSVNELKSFWVQYSSYWSGWRFWLLP